MTKAERSLRDPTTSPEEAERTGAFQQLLYRRLSAHPEWQSPFFAALESDVAPMAANNVSAFLAFQRPPHGPASDTLPAWRIVPPLPAEQLLAYYHDAETTTGVPWYYLASINLVETRMGRINGLSTAGAQGPMQFLPSTWAACCTGDIEDAHDAIIGAATYLKMSGAPDNMDKAILAYNHDTRYLDAIKAYAANMAADERGISAITRGRSSTRRPRAASTCPSATRSPRPCPWPMRRPPPPNPADEPKHYSGAWQTASTLLPSGSRTNAP